MRWCRGKKLHYRRRGAKSKQKQILALASWMNMVLCAVGREKQKALKSKCFFCFRLLFLLYFALALLSFALLCFFCFSEREKAPEIAIQAVKPRARERLVLYNILGLNPS